MIGVVLALAVARPVTLGAVGDVMLARWTERRIARQGPAAMLSRADLREDLVYGNLECAVTSFPATAHRNILLHADPSTAPALRGFSVLSLVNNHASDCGANGLADSAARLRRIGIAPLEPNAAPVILVRDHVRFGFLGLMDLPISHLAPGWIAAVAAARTKCDVLVVGIHWGTEGVSIPNSSQRMVASQLAAAGVDLVLGCHPHVLQPIEWLEGPEGRRCLVAYSLGNFVFDARPGPGSASEILYVRLTRQGVAAYATRRCTIVDCFPVAKRGRLRWVEPPLVSVAGNYRRLRAS